MTLTECQFYFLGKGDEKMEKKILLKATLIIAICCFLMGAICKSTAKKQLGVSAATGVYTNGVFHESSSGRLGANPQKYKVYNTSGTLFYILGIFTSTICIYTYITSKKSK